MNILGANYFRLSNAIFCYGLTPIQLAVYSYLVSCAGQKEKCWPAMKTIAACCGCSKNAARDAVAELDKRGFIYRTARYRDEPNGKTRQTSNNYYILELPNLPLPRPQEMYREAPADGGEMNKQDESNKFKASPEGLESENAAPMPVPDQPRPLCGRSDQKYGDSIFGQAHGVAFEPAPGSFPGDEKEAG